MVGFYVGTDYILRCLQLFKCSLWAHRAPFAQGGLSINRSLGYLLSIKSGRGGLVNIYQTFIAYFYRRRLLKLFNICCVVKICTLAHSVFMVKAVYF